MLKKALILFVDKMKYIKKFEKNMQKDTIFKDYYVGRKGLYHNKTVTILSTNYDIIEYQDFGFDFNTFEIEIYFEDGSKKTEKLKGNLITRNLKLYDKKNDLKK